MPGHSILRMRTSSEHEVNAMHHVKRRDGFRLDLALLAYALRM